jgi:eukaryotic-like serine/threonine-protein kinase
VKGRAALRRALPYIVAAVAGFAIAWLVVWLVIFPADIVPQEGKVPDVVGMQYDRASTRLEREGFEAVEGSSRYHASAPRGTVLAQSPPAGTTQGRGAQIQLELSSGQRSVEVPPIVGMTRDSAAAAVQRAGLALGSVVTRPRDTPRGTVIGTTPDAGTRVSAPSRVDIVLSAGPTAVSMPDLVGRPYDEARTMIEQLGLRVARVNVDSAAFAPFNTVVYQLPGAGARVGNGHAVTLTISGNTQ